MSLIKDGKIYRTSEEQLLHLTEKHLEQVEFNKNVSQKLQELTVASNLGGYNLVRYSFSNIESFSIQSCSAHYPRDLDFFRAGDFVVLNSFNADDIPAYGIVKEDKTIDFIFNGDYAENRSMLICCKAGTDYGPDFDIVMKYGMATNLMSLNANDYKKQVFTVLHDINYGCRTQYVSYDVNGDGKYEFIYIGVDQNGKDGRSIYAISNDTYNSVKNVLRVGDLVVVSDAISSIINHKTKIAGATSGDVLEFVSGDEFIFKCSILGPIGPRGEKGEKGEQGIQGIQGVQGIQGIQGIQGEKGKDGDGLDIKTGILSSASRLPLFAEAEVGDAYRVINTSGSVVSYDLYFKASNGNDWDIQPNWGGVKGEKGDRGEEGPQGVQGVQGAQGPKGNDGASGLSGQVFMNTNSTSVALEKFKFYSKTSNNVIVKLIVHNIDCGVGNNGFIKLGISGKEPYFESEEKCTHQFIAGITDAYKTLTVIRNGETVSFKRYYNSEYTEFAEVIDSIAVSQTGPDCPTVYCEVIPLS